MGKIDQSTKDLGYSIVRMSGGASAVRHAQQRVQASLAIVAPSGDRGDRGDRGEALHSSTASTWSEEEMEVEQKLVGWVLGSKGVVLKEIESQSGARISIDQTTKDMGYSVVRMSGSMESINLARQLVSDKIAQANASGPSRRG